MTKTKYKNAVDEAQKMNKSVADYIQKLSDTHPYSFAAVIMKQLLKKCDETDLEHILFELECAHKIRTFNCQSLVAEMKFEAFKEELEANPYQLKLIA